MIHDVVLPPVLCQQRVELLAAPLWNHRLQIKHTHRAFERWHRKDLTDSASRQNCIASPNKYECVFKMDLQIFCVLWWQAFYQTACRKWKVIDLSLRKNCIKNPPSISLKLELHLRGNRAHGIHWCVVHCLNRKRSALNVSLSLCAVLKISALTTLV